MGHLLSRAIKRFTQCNNGGRNQLAGQSGAEQQAAQTDASQRDHVSDRPTIQSIPVGQSIDSVEYAAFKTASSSLDKNKDNSTSSSHQESPVPALEAAAATTTTTTTQAVSSVTDEKENENEDEAKRSEQQESNTEKQVPAASDQNTPQVEEAVIKIQALVRGHLTRKALKVQQATVTPINALGQSQFNAESLRNPPSAIFSNVSPPKTPNLSNSSSISNQQQSNKLANNRLSALESIAEDAESANSNRARRKISSPRSRVLESISDTSSESAGSQSSPSNEANASIDIYCDTPPASASIDIIDHSTRLMPGIASVLHHRASPIETVPETTRGEGRQEEQLANNNQTNSSSNSTSNNNFELQNGAAAAAVANRLSSAAKDDYRQAMTAPVGSPPHINLALTANSHSIDSAEAAAIRIQSAFRGYHTRKHSPYRRRSPANISSSTSEQQRPVVGGIADPLTNGGTTITTNGAPKRNTLRQQNATILDDDDVSASRSGGRVDGENDNGSEDDYGQRLSEEPVDREPQSIDTAIDSRLGNTEQDSSEQNRQSRQRHRVDETVMIRTAGDGCYALSGQSQAKHMAPVSFDETTNTDDLSTVKELQSEPSGGGKPNEASVLGPEPTVLSVATNKAAADLTSEESAGGNQWQANMTPAGEAHWSTSIDTDSSNLGAALSLNEDLSEDLSQASNRESASRSDGHQRSSSVVRRDSIGAAIEETADEAFATEGGSNLSASEQFSAATKLLDELEKATDQLEATSEEVTDNDACSYGDQLAANLADRCLDDESQHLNELESDDIERRHPSGVFGNDGSRDGSVAEQQQQHCAESSASGHAANTMESSQMASSNLDQARLEAISPDEAIGSDGSSPALVESHEGNSSDEGAESEQEQDGQQAATSGGDVSRAANQQPAGNGNKGRKRNRNKRKGKK